MSAAERLVVLAWNLHGLPFTRQWNRRVERFAARVAQLAVPTDLLLCSEVWLAGYERALCNALAPSFVPVSLPSGQRPAGGLVAYLRRDSEWRLLRQSFQLFRHTAPWWRLWEGDSIGGKGIRTLVLERATQRAAILHTHMQAQYGVRTYASVRSHQWAQLTRRAFSASATASFVCAAGDLNTTPTENVFTSYARYWQDLSAPLRQAGMRSTTTNRPDEWIDHVLALAPTATRIRSCSISLLDAHDSFGAISDHHGLVASLELEPSGFPPSLRTLHKSTHTASNLPPRLG